MNNKEIEEMKKTISELKDKEQRKRKVNRKFFSFVIFILLLCGMGVMIKAAFDMMMMSSDFGTIMAGFGLMLFGIKFSHFAQIKMMHYILA